MQVRQAVHKSMEAYLQRQIPKEAVELPTDEDREKVKGTMQPPPTLPQR